MNLTIIFFCSLFYDAIGTPLKEGKFNPKAVLSKYTLFVLGLINRSKEAKSMRNMRGNDVFYVDFIVGQGIGYWKILLCGYCQATWVLFFYHAFATQTFIQFLEQFALSMIVNTLFFKFKYQ